MNEEIVKEKGVTVKDVSILKAPLVCYATMNLEDHIKVV